MLQQQLQQQHRQYKIYMYKRENAINSSALFFSLLFSNTKDDSLFFFPSLSHFVIDILVLCFRSVEQWTYGRTYTHTQPIYFSCARLYFISASFSAFALCAGCELKPRETSICNHTWNGNKSWLQYFSTKEEKKRRKGSMALVHFIEFRNLLLTHTHTHSAKCKIYFRATR